MPSGQSSALQSSEHMHLRCRTVQVHSLQQRLSAADRQAAALQQLMAALQQTADRLESQRGSLQEQLSAESEASRVREEKLLQLHAEQADEAEARHAAVARQVRSET